MRGSQQADPARGPPRGRAPEWGWLVLRAPDAQVLEWRKAFEAFEPPPHKHATATHLDGLPRRVEGPVEGEGVEAPDDDPPVRRPAAWWVLRDEEGCECPVQTERQALVYAPSHGDACALHRLPHPPARQCVHMCFLRGGSLPAMNPRACAHEPEEEAAPQRQGQHVIVVAP